MAEKLVGKISEFKDGDRRIVFLGDHEIGVFRENGTFYAYSNYCLHQGGPACEGLTIAKVEDTVRNLRDDPNRPAGLELAVTGSGVIGRDRTEARRMARSAPDLIIAASAETRWLPNVAT